MFFLSEVWAKILFVIKLVLSLSETVKQGIGINSYPSLSNLSLASPLILLVLPETVTDIAVLDRTKEFGANAPLYLDVSSCIKENNLDISVYGGRYGLSSKDTTPSDIKSVYDFL